MISKVIYLTASLHLNSLNYFSYILMEKITVHLYVIQSVYSRVNIIL